MYRRLSSASSHFRSWVALKAKRPRKIAARNMRKIQVPTYWPVVEGIQLEEYKGVIVEVKKTIIIDDIGIMVELAADMSMFTSVVIVAFRKLKES